MTEAAPHAPIPDWPRPVIRGAFPRAANSSRGRRVRIVRFLGSRGGRKPESGTLTNRPGPRPRPRSRPPKLPNLLPNRVPATIFQAPASAPFGFHYPSSITLGQPVSCIRIFATVKLVSPRTRPLGTSFAVLPRVPHPELPSGSPVACPSPAATTARPVMALHPIADIQNCEIPTTSVDDILRPSPPIGKSALKT